MHRRHRVDRVGNHRDTRDAKRSTLIRAHRRIDGVDVHGEREDTHRREEQKCQNDEEGREAELLRISAAGEADAELASSAPPAVLVTGSDNWHPGIVGLIAARLKEYARRPAFAISFNPNGTGTGSGRSITGFDLGRLVREAVEEGLLVKGGGHAKAAGITVERARLGELRAFFDERASEAVAKLRAGEALAIDAALSADGATLELCETLERAGPFGAGHPQPVLALPRHQIVDAATVGANIEALISHAGAQPWPR
jgi:single-stranded-DNA-specific exonuclease